MSNTAMAAVNINDMYDVRRKGISALKDALGSVGMVIFMQQFETGTGDYTKEKYNKPELSMEELDILLKYGV